MFNILRVLFNRAVKWIGSCLCQSFRVVLSSYDNLYMLIYICQKLFVGFWVIYSFRIDL